MIYRLLSFVVDWTVVDWTVVDWAVVDCTVVDCKVVEAFFAPPWETNPLLATVGVV